MFNLLDLIVFSLRYEIRTAHLFLVLLQGIVIRGVAMTPQSPAPNLVNATFGKSPVVRDFKGAYATVPAGVYFGTEFSISFWVKTENGNSARLFEPFLTF